jgi:hypothetical protein
MDTTTETGRKAIALDRAITYCANLDEIRGTVTTPVEVVKVAEEFRAYLESPGADTVTSGGSGA